VPIDKFTSTYRSILQRVKDDRPACKLVLCEPSVIWLNHEPASSTGHMLIARQWLIATQLL
jgi:hypothetical protein